MRKGILIFTLLFALSLISCEVSYDSMLTEFNERFSSPVDYSMKEVPSIGDPEFNASKMIPESQYFVRKDMVLELFGPGKGQSYKWIAMVPKTGNESDREEIVISTEKNIAYLLPGVFDSDGNGENILCLIVTGSDGTEYKDSARIIIYN